MLRLCDILGISINDMTEILSMLAAIIMSSVFMGHFLYGAFLAFLDLVADILSALYRMVRKHFPNVRKNKNN